LLWISESKKEQTMAEQSFDTRDQERRIAAAHEDAAEN
jgi:hypothetical protein